MSSFTCIFPAAAVDWKRSQTLQPWNGAWLLTGQEGMRGDLKVVGRGWNDRGRIQSSEIRLMHYDISVRKSCTETPHLHRMYLEMFGDVGSGEEFSLSLWRSALRKTQVCFWKDGIWFLLEWTSGENIFPEQGRGESMPKNEIDVSLAATLPHTDAFIHAGICRTCRGLIWRPKLTPA